MRKKLIAELLLVFVTIPFFIAVGTFVYFDRRYLLFSFSIALLSCLLFFLSFENRERSTHLFVIIAAMTALSVVGRLIFAPIPFFKPVTAVVIICGITLGSEAGFICGALSAFLSNFIFMQGPWTPFQMFIWGLIGFGAGILSGPLKSSKFFLLLYGVLSGFLYSAFMDIWTTLWWDATFDLERYLAALVAALPITMIYIVSNVIFLILLTKPICKKLKRIKQKYGIS